MTDYRTYYCNMKVDVTFNAGNLPKQNISDLNNRIENAISEWGAEMAEKGLTVGVGWNWSEHCDLHLEV